MEEVAPDSAVTQGDSTAATHHPMLGKIVAPVSVAFLLLLGIIFYLLHRVTRKSSSGSVDMPRATSDVPLRPVSSQTIEGRESSMITEGQNPFINTNDPPQRNSTTPPVATTQGQRCRATRYSQMSVTSSISRSIRFAVRGSVHSPTDSHTSRANVSVIAVDGTHTPEVDPFGEPPPSPWRPASSSTSLDFSASWRGTNLSNIINAARGIKG
jgi:hypothetical protein